MIELRFHHELYDGFALDEARASEAKATLLWTSVAVSVPVRPG